MRPTTQKRLAELALVLPVALSVAPLIAAPMPDDPGCARDTRPRDALADFISTFERGDLAALGSRIDPAMLGYANFLDGAALDVNRSKVVRIHLFDTVWQCGPDLVVIQTSWEKRYLDAVTFQPQLTSGRMSVLLFQGGERTNSERTGSERITGQRWRIAAVAGPHPFGATAGVPAEVTFGPTLDVSAAGAGAVPVTLTITDSDLMRRGSVEVLLRSSNGDRELFVTPTSTPGRFQRTTLPVAVGAARIGDGVLQVDASGSVRLEFVDEQPGHGRPATIVRRTAFVTGTPGGPVAPPPGPGTPTADMDPDPFAIVFPTSSRPPSTLFASAPIVVSGVSGPVTISALGGDYSVNGGAFTTVPGVVSNGNVVIVRLRTSPVAAGIASVTLTIGARSETVSLQTDS